MLPEDDTVPHLQRGRYNSTILQHLAGAYCKHIGPSREVPVAGIVRNDKTALTDLIFFDFFDEGFVP
jgi:hypothetical protein